MLEGFVVVDITIDPIEDAGSPQFSEGVIEVFAALAKEFIVGITEAADGVTKGLGQCGGVGIAKRVVKRLGIVRWFTFAVGAGDD